jgi:hypothetical protein
MASAVIGALRVNLGIDSAEFSDGLKKSKDQLSAFGESMEKTAGKLSSVGQSLSLYLTAPLVAFGAAAVAAAGDSAKATAAVQAALTSMGNGVGYSLEQLQDLASGLQNVSTFDDDDIMSKVTANLLTFGKVTGDVFARAQQSALDLSARLGTDLQGSAIMLGKAMNDPIKGISALTRVGVSFTEQQKDQVKAMIKSGDLLGAQRMILDELEKQYAGQAAALAGTDPGKIASAWVAIGDAMEGIGAVILPVLGQFAQWVKSVAQAFSALTPETQQWIVIAGGIAAAIGPALIALGVMVSTIGSLLPLLPALGAAMSAAFGPIGLVIGGVAAAYLIFGDNVSAAAKATADSEGAYRNNIGLLDAAKSSSEGYTMALRNQIAMQVEAARTAAIQAQATSEAAFDRAANFRKTFGGVKFTPFEYFADQSDKDALKASEVYVALNKQLAEVDKNMKAVNTTAVTITPALAGTGKAAAAGATEAKDAWEGLRTVSDGVKEKMAALQQETRAIDDAWTEFGRGGRDIFEGLIDGTMTWKDALKSAIPIIQDLITNLMNAQNPSGFGGGIFGSILNGLTGLGSGSSSYFPPAPSGGLAFASGGSIMPGGVGGIDSQLVQFRKSPNERVDITKPGQQLTSGGGYTDKRTYTIDARGAEHGVEQKIRAALQEYDRQVLPESIDRFQNDPHRRG